MSLYRQRLAAQEQRLSSKAVDGGQGPSSRSASSKAVNGGQGPSRISAMGEQFVLSRMTRNEHLASGREGAGPVKTGRTSAAGAKKGAQAASKVRAPADADLEDAWDRLGQ